MGVGGARIGIWVDEDGLASQGDILGSSRVL